MACVTSVMEDAVGVLRSGWGLMMNKYIHSLSFVLLSGCASVEVCGDYSIPGDVLVDTAAEFIEHKLGLDYELSYEVGRFECGYVVIASILPVTFDSDFFIFIDERGVYRATSPRRRMFDVKGDRLWGLPPSDPYPLVIRR